MLEEKKSILQQTLDRKLEKKVVKKPENQIEPPVM